MILEDATPYDLLLWQRVNKTWQAAIQRSPQFQEKLYFRDKICEDENIQDRTVLNPFMNKLFIRKSFHSWLFMAEGAFSGKASCPTASWRQMLITRPAITELQIFRNADLRSAKLLDPGWSNACRIGYMTVACESGVTMGQLADAQKSSSCFFHGYHDNEHSDWISLDNSEKSVWISLGRRTLERNSLVRSRPPH